MSRQSKLELLASDDNDFYPASDRRPTDWKPRVKHRVWAQDASPLANLQSLIGQMSH